MNKKGVSILEVMVAIGLMGVVGLGVMQMSKTMFKQQAGHQAQYSTNVLEAELRRALVNEKNCTQTMRSHGVILPSLTPLNLGSVRAADNTVLYQVGEKYDNNAVMLQELRVENYQSFDDPHNGVAELYFTIERMKEGYAGKEITKKMIVNMKLNNVDNSVEKCSATYVASSGGGGGGSGGGSYWILDPSNYNLYYQYNDANVGIGVNSPEGTLHVLRTQETGPELILDTLGDISATQYWVKGDRKWATYAIKSENDDRFSINYENDEGETTTHFTISADGQVGIGAGAEHPKGALYIYRPEATGAELILDTAGAISATQYWVNGKRKWATFSVFNTPTEENPNIEPADRFGINYEDDAGVTKTFLTVDKSGQVGIGENSHKPQGTLYVHRPEDTGAELVLDTDGIISATQYWVKNKRKWAMFALDNGTDDDRLGINYENDAGDTKTFLTVDSSGQVGIGDNSHNPQGTLYIHRPEVTGAELVLDTDGPVSATQYWINGDRKFATFAVRNEPTVENGLTEVEERFGINYEDSSGNTNTFFTVDKTGYVGIGNGSHNPQGTLYVYRPETTGPEFVIDTAGDVSATQYWIRGDRKWATFAISNGSGEERFGINFENSSGSTSTHFTIRETGYVGIGTTAPAEQLHVQGNLMVQGSTTCTLGNGSGGTNCSSDIRLKDDVREIPNALEKIRSLRGVEFVWNDRSNAQGRDAIGVIAQDILETFPTAVTEDPDGFLQADYAVLTAPLIEATKELANNQDDLMKQVNSLKEENKILKAELVEIKELLKRIK